MLRSCTSPSSAKARENGRGGGEGALAGESADVGSPLTRFSPLNSARIQDGDNVSVSDLNGESEPLLSFFASKSKDKQSDPDLVTYNFRPVNAGSGKTDVNGAQAGGSANGGRASPHFEREEDDGARAGGGDGYVEPSPTNRAPSWNEEEFPQSVPGVTGDGRQIPGVAGLGKWVVRDGLFAQLFPALAVLQWWFFNVLLLLLNKWIFQVYAFNFPLTLTTIHFVMSFIGAYICIQILHLRPLAKVSRGDLLLRILPMALVTNLNVCLGNVSLKFIPVTFMQTLKAFTPATTGCLAMLCHLASLLQLRIAIETIILCCAFHFIRPEGRLYFALIPVVGGVTLSSATELSFHFWGFLSAVLSTVFTSANSVLAELLLKGHVEMDSMNIVYYIAPQICFMLFPLAVVLEGADVVRWHYNIQVDVSRVPLLAVLFSGVLAFGLNFSLFYAIQATSAMTFNVAGNFKVAVAMLLGWLIFKNPMSAYSTLGCAVTVIGCTSYGYVQHRVCYEQQMQEIIRLSPKLSPKLASHLENARRRREGEDTPLLESGGGVNSPRGQLQL